MESEINAELLEKVIADNGLKKNKIAEELGMTRHSLTNKIKGRSKFTLVQTYRLSDLLGIRGTVLESKIFCPTKTQKVSN